jgi:formamidopyrimidine-DNA glycosylase
MPELPEVETIRAGLAKLLPGKTIKDVWYDWDKSFPNAPSDVARFLVNARIDKVRRRAKVLIIELSGGWALIIHLKMTGQLVIVTGDKNQQKLENSNQKLVKNTNSELLISNSMFGGGHPTKSLLGDLPDKSTRVVIDFTDGAKLHPATLTDKIPKDKLVILYNAIREVLALSIAKGGSTDKNYVNAEGKQGSYLSFANVFRKEGQPCPRCGTPIEKIRVAGRGTHICPHDQKVII